jgi:3-phytase
MSQRDPRGPSRRRRGRPAPLLTALGLAAAPLLTACAANSDEPAADVATGAPGGDFSLAADPVGTVSATAETEPVPHDGDAADDPAVWANPGDPSSSAIIATDKQGAMLVYGMDGQEIHRLPAGDMNNVDVRSGFPLGDRTAVLVVAGNRSSNSIGVYELDPATRQLREVNGDAIRPDLEVYGSCLYVSAATGRLYAFVNSKDGEVEQWELSDDGAGAVRGQQVRTFRVESQTEGCVADDELGHLYLGEETRGIWKFGAEPEAGGEGALIADVSSDGPLVGQVEGMTLAHGPGGTGYLIASSQGDDSYAVFRREGDNAYVGTFRIVAGGGIDGTEETDGIDVSTADLGSGFPSGIFVAQDGANDGAAQNFKLVPLEAIFAG